jgi:hypothetical protein
LLKTHSNVQLQKRQAGEKEKSAGLGDATLIAGVRATHTGREVKAAGRFLERANRGSVIITQKQVQGR